MLTFAVLFACAPETIVVKGDDGTDLDEDGVIGDGVGDTDDTGAEDTGGDDVDEDAAWDGATLVVHSPASGSFLPWGETSTFSATVYAADGTATDFDDIAWASDVDAAWAIEGREVEDDALDVGTHALTATAALPNGDRLAYSVGGVLVQSPYAGVYAGTLVVDAAAEYDGTTYAAGCSGALTLVVDAYGETVTGEGGCLLSLQGYDLDTTYVFDLENAEGTVAGAASADFGWYAYDFDAAGTVSEDGALSGTFADDVYGYLAVEGAWETTRVSRDVSAYQE